MVYLTRASKSLVDAAAERKSKITEQSQMFCVADGAWAFVFFGLLLAGTDFSVFLKWLKCMLLVEKIRVIITAIS